MLGQSLMRPPRALTQPPPNAYHHSRRRSRSFVRHVSSRNWGSALSGSSGAAAAAAAEALNDLKLAFE